MTVSGSCAPHSLGRPAVAVVTDSTAYLPDGLAERHGLHVVPLHVRIGDRIGRDGTDIGPGELAAALSGRRCPVATSRPTPAELARCYQSRLASGADAVVSVHLSRKLSGTWESARMAAEQVGRERVRVVDSRSTAMGLGFAVLAAVHAAAEGAGPAQVEAVAADVAARTSTFFSLETLEHLRRGGRIGTAAALLGTALAVKVLLHVTDGLIVPLEKVRTTARALARLEELACTAAGAGPVDLAVHHLAVPERAERLAARLAARLPGLRRCLVSEVGAAIGAHTGPGMLGVVVLSGGVGSPDGAEALGTAEGPLSG